MEGRAEGGWQQAGLLVGRAQESRAAAVRDAGGQSPGGCWGGPKQRRAGGTGACDALQGMPRGTEPGGG